MTSEGDTTAGEGPSTSSGKQQLPPIRSSRSATTSPSRSMRGTQDSDSLPPPRAKHTLVNMDPDYLNTVAYVEKPGIGRIYDYRTHHAKNEELAKKKEEKRRAQDIVDAAKKEIAYQSVSSKAFDQWRAQKLLEKEMKSVIKTTITVQRKKQGGKVSEEEMTKIRNEREAKWMGGFGSPATLHKTRVARVSGSKDSQEPIQSEKLWRSEKFY